MKAPSFIGLLALVIVMQGCVGETEKKTASHQIGIAISDIDWSQKWPAVKDALDKRFPKSRNEWLDATISSKLPRAIPRGIDVSVMYLPIKDGRREVGIYVGVGDDEVVKAVVFWNFPSEGLATSLEKTN